MNFVKSKTSIGGYQKICKPCFGLYSARYRAKALLKQKEAYKNDPEPFKERMKKYAQENKEKIRLAEKRPWVKISRLIRARMKEVSKKKFIPHSYKAAFTIKQLKAHFESIMRTGMSWDNYGEWCVDHIKPICLWDMQDSNQRLLMNNLDNLQCLWLKENEYKGKNYDPDHPMGWHGLDKFLIERGEPTPWLDNK